MGGFYHGVYGEGGAGFELARGAVAAVCYEWRGVEAVADCAAGAAAFEGVGVFIGSGGHNF